MAFKYKGCIWGLSCVEALKLELGIPWDVPVIPRFRLPHFSFNGY